MAFSCILLWQFFLQIVCFLFYFKDFNCTQSFILTVLNVLLIILEYQLLFLILNQIMFFTFRCQDGYYGDPRVGVRIPCRPCLCPGGPGSLTQHADTCSFDPRSQEVFCNCYPGYQGKLTLMSALTWVRSWSFLFIRYIPQGFMSGPDLLILTVLEAVLVLFSLTTMLQSMVLQEA